MYLNKMKCVTTFVVALVMGKRLLMLSHRRGGGVLYDFIVMNIITCEIG